MNPTEQLEQHKKLVDDAIRQRKMERVPHLSNFALWPVLDYGVTLSAACRDWELMEKVWRAFMDKYRFDCSGTLGAFFCNPPRMLDRIGPGYNVFDDEAGTVMLSDFDLMQPEDYDYLLTDLPGLVWNRLLPRKFERWGQVTVGDFKEAIDEYLRFTSYMQRMDKVCVEEYGLPSMAGHMINMPGIELLFNNFRGFRGTSHDIRRIPDKVMQVVEMFDAKDDVVYNIFLEKPASDTYAFDTVIGLTSHNFLSTSQWEKYLWPYVKRVLDAAIQTDSTVFIFAQGVISRFYDYFQDVPAGHLAIQIEQDDVFDFKAKLPNVCVVGGMSTQLLGSGTVKQCVDYAKFLCDELGREGGFILSQEKMMSYLRDAKPENIKAVCDFVADYSL
ncbi:MAG: hypothetical protein FWH50_02305 [Coriobacteriia bacterium]|nr:hypothetical protein [Coriobacteriia bacterium]